MEKLQLVIIINYLLQSFGYELTPIIHELKKQKKAHRLNNKKITFNTNIFNRAALARELGISRPYVSLLFSGKRKNSYRIKQLNQHVLEQLSPTKPCAKIEHR